MNYRILAILIILLIFFMCLVYFYLHSNLVGKKYKFICPKVKTHNPKIGGPDLWSSLHIMAENYPQVPTNSYINSCKKFLSGLPLMLPCKTCQNNLSYYINNYNLDNICRNRQSFSKFLANCHNNVNFKLGKPHWNYNSKDYQLVHACLH